MHILMNKKHGSVVIVGILVLLMNIGAMPRQRPHGPFVPGGGVCTPISFADGPDSSMMSGQTFTSSVTLKNYDVTAACTSADVRISDTQFASISLGSVSIPKCVDVNNCPTQTVPVTISVIPHTKGTLTVLGYYSDGTPIPQYIGILVWGNKAYNTLAPPVYPGGSTVRHKGKKSEKTRKL